MAKIVSFIKSSTTSSNRARGRRLDSFVDDGDLLEFSRPEDIQAQAHNRTRAQPHPTSVFASDWSNQELADLYRAYCLIQSAQPGLECDRGISDEGDPWFLIGDAKSDVLVHICRIQGTYILDSVALSKVLKGVDFNALIQDFLATVVGEQAHGAGSANEPANVVRLARGSTVCLHPSMMIAALVWTLLTNADELSLPAATDTGQKRPDQRQGIDQSEDQDTILLGDLPGEDITYSDYFLEKPGSWTVEPSDALSTAAIISQIAQRDEKQLHVSAYSHALTTVAIAAGFYASAEAADAFWKSIPASTDTSVSFGETGDRETRDLITPPDHLSDALALLSSVVDKVVFESNDDYAAENHNAGEASADALPPEATDAVEASIAQQMLTMESEVFNRLADASRTQTDGAPGKGVEAAPDFASVDTMQAEMTASLHDKDLARNEQAFDSSIQSITQNYLSSDLNVSRYDTSSLQTAIREFNGELQIYSEVFESVAFPAQEESTHASGTSSEASSEDEVTVPEFSYLNAFDDAARNFIDAKVANADLEILVFENEIILVDRAALSGNNTAVSWQLDDGGIVSMIGLSNDMNEFLVA